jgi:uncharacterized protein YoaH (UPF0181 family)
MHKPKTFHSQDEDQEALEYIKSVLSQPYGMTVSDSEAIRIAIVAYADQLRKEQEQTRNDR